MEDVKRAECEALADKTLGRIHDKEDGLSLLNQDEINEIEEATQNLKDYLKYNINATPKEMEEEKKIFQDFMEPFNKKAQVRKNLNDLAKSLLSRLSDKDDALSNISSNEKKKIKRCIKGYL